MLEGADAYASSSTIHRKTQPTPEVVGRMNQVYEAKTSRLSRQTILAPMVLKNEFNGSDFTPIIPDNSPTGTIMAVKSFEPGTQKVVAQVYEVEIIDGKLAVKLISASTSLKKTIDIEVTGNGLGPYDPPVKLPVLDIGDNIESKNATATAFQSINQPRKQAGDDYFTVAIATPNRLRRFAR